MPQPNNPGLRGRRFLYALGAVVLVALLLRGVISAQLCSNYRRVKAPLPQSDAHTYQRLAGEILDGTYDFDQGFDYQPFYYTVFLPAIYTVSGRGPWGVIVAQALLGALAVGLTGLAFAQLFGRRAALLGAGLLALSRMHVFYTPFTLIAALQSFWMALLIHLLR